MDTTNKIQETEVKKMPEINAASLKSLEYAAKWSKFLSIIGFIVTAFMLVVGIVLFIAYGPLVGEHARGAFDFSPKLFSGLIIFFALFGFYPVYLLNSFSNFANKTAANPDIISLNKALRNLSSHFKVIGIYTVSILLVYTLLLIIIFVSGTVGA